MVTERRGSDQFRTPYKMITEVIVIEDAYATGGWTLQSKQLTLLERATCLQGIFEGGCELCNAAVPPDMTTGLLTGNTFKLKGFYLPGADALFTSGHCKIEVADGSHQFSGWSVVMLLEGR